MKAIVNIEFILSVFVFLTVIVFVMVFILKNMPLLAEKSLSENLQSASYQVSELLLDKGHPADWHTLDIDSVARIGLESEDHVLDPAKISRLSSLCADPANYYKLREKFMGNDFLILVNGSTEILDCKPPVVSLIRPKFVTFRHAVYNGNAVDLTVVILG